MASLILKPLFCAFKTGAYAPNFLRVGQCIIANHQQVCGLKDLIKIKWKRPDEVPFNDTKKTGDLIPILSDSDLNNETKKTALEFVKCESLKEADENVKKVFSCGFHGRKYAVDRIKKDTVDSIKRHELDKNSREVRIAKYTVSIRKLQVHYKRQPNDKLRKIFLKELIDKRNKELRFLREENYKLFEWLLEELQIVFRPGPTIKNHVWRKESLRRLVDKHIEDVKTKRLTELRNKFNEEKIEFFKKSAETLEWILEQEIKYGRKPTVTKEEIEYNWNKYKELSEKELEKYSPPKHYHQFA